MKPNTNGPAKSIRAERTGDKVAVTIEREDGAVITLSLTLRAALDLANRLIVEAMR